MINIIKEELPIEESLRKKLELICEFAKVTPTLINGNIRKIDRTNLTYIEPNRIIIKDKTFLIFNFIEKFSLFDFLLFLTILSTLSLLILLLS